MKSSKYLLAPIFCLVFAFSPLTSQAEEKNSPQYVKCLDSVDHGGMKKSQWAACAAEELKRQDVTLNAHYIKLRNQLNQEQRQSLTKGQRAWLKFREDWCRFEEVSPFAPGGVANYYECLTETTGKHIETLKLMAND